MTRQGTALLTLCALSIAMIGSVLIVSPHQGVAAPMEQGERRSVPEPLPRRESLRESRVMLIPAPPAEPPPDEGFIPPTVEAHVAWDELHTLADRAGIRLDPRRQLSFGEWQWLAQRVTLFLAASDSIEAEMLPAIEQVMTRKLMTGDFEVVTPDMDSARIHEIHKLTLPGQRLAFEGEAGITKVVRINLLDDYTIEAGHLALIKLERELLAEAMLRLGIR